MQTPSLSRDAFAVAEAHAELALAGLNAIAAAAARAGAVAKHVAEALQLGTGDFVFATAMNLATAGALLELNLASRHDAEIAGSRGRAISRLPRRRWGGPGAARHCTFRNDCASHRPTLLLNDGSGRRVCGIAQTAWTRKNRALQKNPFLGFRAGYGAPRNRLQSKPNSCAAFRTRDCRKLRINICLRRKIVQ